MTILRTIKSGTERGGMMLEAVMMLGMVSMMTPYMFKQNDDRRQEIEDVAVANQTRTILDAANAFMEANYGTISEDGTITVPGGTDINASGTTFDVSVDALRKTGFLQESFSDQNAFGQTYSVRVKKESLASGELRVDALLTADNGSMTVDTLRGRRIASMIGNGGGYVGAANNIEGAMGAWDVADSSATYGKAVNAGSLAATTTYQRNVAMSDHLYRNHIPGFPDANTMGTSMRMRGNTAFNFAAFQANPDNYQAGTASIIMNDGGARQSIVGAAFIETDALQVNQTMTVGADFSVAGNTTLGDDPNTDVLTVNSIANLNGVLNVVGATHLQNTLEVDSTANFHSNVNVDGSFYIYNEGGTNKFSVTGATGNLWTAGSVDIDQNLNVDGYIRNASSSVDVRDDLYIQNDSGTDVLTIDNASGNLTTAGRGTFNNGMTISGTRLHVDSAEGAYIDGDLRVRNDGNTNKFTVAHNTGDIWTGGNLNVNGYIQNSNSSVDVRDDLYVQNDSGTDVLTIDNATGNTWTNGTLNTEGNTYVDADFYVRNEGNSTKFSVVGSSGNVTTSGTMDVTGHTRLRNNVEVYGYLYNNMGGVAVQDDFSVRNNGGSTKFSVRGNDGEIYTASNLRALGYSTVSGNSTVGGSLDVTGSSLFRNSVTVNGTTTLHSHLYQDGDMYVRNEGGTNKFSVKGATGDVETYGNLTLQGNGSYGKNIVVENGSGSTVFKVYGCDNNGSVWSKGYGSFDGGLSTASNLTASGKVSFDGGNIYSNNGHLFLKNNFYMDGTGWMSLSGSTLYTGGGDVKLAGGKLDTEDGSITNSYGTTVNVNDSLAVSGNTTVGGTATITGKTTMTGGFTSNQGGVINEPDTYQVGLTVNAGSSGQSGWTDGVRVYAHGDSNWGVYTQSYGNYGSAIQGHSTGNYANGVYGTAYGINSKAVYGYASGNNSKGMYGYAAGNDSIGVHAYQSGNYAGAVAFKASSPSSYDNWGVTAEIERESKYGYGLKITRGNSNDDYGYGLYIKNYGGYGMKNYSYGDYSTGAYNYTSGNYVTSVKGNAYGNYADGGSFYASGNNSEGIHTSAYGNNSAGIYSYANGDNSYAMRAVAGGSGAVALVAETPSWASNYGNTVEVNRPSTGGIGLNLVAGETADGSWTDGMYIKSYGSSTYALYSRGYGNYARGGYMYASGNYAKGLYASASGTGSYAGYFSGDVYVSGCLKVGGATYGSCSQTH